MRTVIGFVKTVWLSVLGGVLGKWRWAVWTSIGTLLATQAAVLWTAPDDEPFVFSSVERRPQRQLQLKIGGLSSGVDIVQTGFLNSPDAGFPNRDTMTDFTLRVLDGELIIRGGWHPCNPVTYLGTPVNEMGQGVGCQDRHTSGGHLTFVGRSSDAAITLHWILAGTSGAVCTLELGDLTPDRLELLARLRQWQHDWDAGKRVLPMAPIDANVGVATAVGKLPATNDSPVKFSNDSGRVTVTAANRSKADWNRQIRAGFRDSYLVSDEEPLRRVVGLLLREVLQHPRFLEEMEFVAGHRAGESNRPAR